MIYIDLCLLRFRCQGCWFLGRWRSQTEKYDFCNPKVCFSVWLFGSLQNTGERKWRKSDASNQPSPNIDTCHIICPLLQFFFLNWSSYVLPRPLRVRWCQAWPKTPSTVDGAWQFFEVFIIFSLQLLVLRLCVSILYRICWSIWLNIFKH